MAAAHTHSIVQSRERLLRAIGLPPAGSQDPLPACHPDIGMVRVRHPDELLRRAPSKPAIGLGLGLSIPSAYHSYTVIEDSWSSWTPRLPFAEEDFTALGLHEHRRAIYSIVRDSKEECAAPVIATTAPAAPKLPHCSIFAPFDPTPADEASHPLQLPNLSGASISIPLQDECQRFCLCPCEVSPPASAALNTTLEVPPAPRLPQESTFSPFDPSPLRPRISRRSTARFSARPPPLDIKTDSPLDAPLSSGTPSLVNDSQLSPSTAFSLVTPSFLPSEGPQLKTKLPAAFPDGAGIVHPDSAAVVTAGGFGLGFIDLAHGDPILDDASALPRRSEPYDGNEDVFALGPLTSSPKQRGYHSASDADSEADAEDDGFGSTTSSPGRPSFSLSPFLAGGARRIPTWSPTSSPSPSPSPAESPADSPCALKLERKLRAVLSTRNAGGHAVGDLQKGESVSERSSRPIGAERGRGQTVNGEVLRRQAMGRGRGRGAGIVVMQTRR